MTTSSDRYPKQMPNDIRTQGVMATTNPFTPFNSANRLKMLAAHLNQTAHPKNADIPRSLTSLETQLRAFDIRMPFDGVVVSVHRRVKFDLGSSVDKEDPMISLIVQDTDTGEYDCINIVSFLTHHTIYGVKLIIQPIVQRLRTGMRIAKDTLFAANPAVHDGGIFSSGLSCSVVNLSLDFTNEDGFGVSESFCKRASLLELNSVDIQFGKKFYLLNAYGDENNFKAYPGIGDKVREDGLIVAMREYDENFDALGMTNKALMKIDAVTDVCYYGVPNSTVYDLIIDTSIRETKAAPKTPVVMSAQSMRYVNHTESYYQSIIETYESILRVNKNPKLSPDLAKIITRAYAHDLNGNRWCSKQGGQIRAVYKRAPLDEFRIEFKMQSFLELNRGAKSTNFHGNKGVTTRIIPDDQMPVDEDGNVVDLIKFGKAVVARLNTGQLVEQFVNAASRDLTKWIIANNNLFPYHQETANIKVKLENWVESDMPNNLPLDVVWGRLVDYYQAAAHSLNHAIVTRSDFTHEMKIHHIKTIVENGIYLWIRPDSAGLTKHIQSNIEKVIKPTRGKLHYTDCLGRRRTFKDKMFVGIEQIIVLEKTDMHPSAISSSNVQIHGLVSGANKAARLCHPSKIQATKVVSETEVRLYSANMDSIAFADYMACNNSPEAHCALVTAMLNSDTPSSNVVKPVFSRESNRALAIVKQVLHMSGIRIKSGITTIMNQYF